MQTRRMGAQGPEVSAVGIGAMSFSDFYGPTTDEASMAILDAAMDLGITHIDTSNIYGMGRSETVIGRWLAANPGARDQVYLATKAGISRNARGERCFDNSAAHLTGELEKSLQKLGTDAVDLFYVHRRDSSVEIEEVAETLAGIVKSGKAKAVGFSEIAPTSLRRAAAVCPIAAVQSEYSLATRFVELGLVEACAETDTALVAFSPVARTLLTDRPMTPERAAELPFCKDNPRFMGRNLTANIAATEPFRAYAAEIGEPTAALAIAWLLTRGDHVLPIPGTRSVNHLKELARGGEMILTPDQVARIEAILRPGWTHGDRYSAEQWIGPERFC
ncbi:MAG: aldo/keto reductase [Qingshengfaniella sp.]